MNNWYTFLQLISRKLGYLCESRMKPGEDTHAAPHAHKPQVGQAWHIAYLKVEETKVEIRSASQICKIWQQITNGLTPLLPVCFRLKPAVFTCLGNGLTHQAIVLESCSNPQKTRQIFKSVMKTKNFGFGF